MLTLRYRPIIDDFHPQFCLRTDMVLRCRGPHIAYRVTTADGSARRQQPRGSDPLTADAADGHHHADLYDAYVQKMYGRTLLRHFVPVFAVDTFGVALSGLA